MKSLENWFYSLGERCLAWAQHVWAEGQRYWIWYCYATAVTSILFFLQSLFVTGSIFMSFFDLGFLVVFPSVFATLVVGLGQICNVLLVAAMIKKMPDKNPQAIHLFGASLTLTLLKGSWLVLCFGVAILLSPGFRHFVTPWAPAWYQSIVGLSERAS
ncbi:MAG: hypothetical protein AAF202_08625 [Pseudomonadota bacterium]